MEKTVERIKVAIRCRPLTSKEKKVTEKEIIYVDNKRHEVIIKEPENKKKPNVFTYDHVYGQNSTQEEIYKDCGKPIVDYLFEGFNCTIFAYGQTGTGKTFTMEGSSEQQYRGIIPRTFSEIFNAINNAPQNVEYLVRVSMLELYNEKLKDSLSPQIKDNRYLEIHGDTEKGFFVKNLQEFNVTNVKELEKKLEYGKANRQVRATEMNDYSSRSHSIFTIIIESSKTDEDGNKSFRIGKLNMVDLAGSEKQKKTQTSDEALKEGIKINLSLSNLINVINLLVKGAQHIPYRNSLLTKLLADSLGGNSKTIMIANIGPAGSNYSETLQTLKYANRAKQIKNKPKINEDSKDALLRQKQEELEMLKLQIQRMGMGNTRILKSMNSLGSNQNKIDNYKENINSTIQQSNQRSNNQISNNEKSKLQKQLTFQQEKVKQQETEKQKLIQKYNAMCNDIITHHDYQKDINNAKEELNKLNSDDTYQKNYLKTKKLLAEKKQHLNKMDQKSKKVQEAIQNLNQKIIQSREKITDIKQNKNDIKQQLQRKVENLSKRLSQNRILLKQQHFYLHNLIPENFTKMMESKFLNLRQNQVNSYSLLDLQKPISTTYYQLLDSYQNSYVNKIKMKKKQIEYPNDSDIYSNNFLSDPSLDSKFLNLQYFSMENGDLFNIKTNSIENLKQLICGKFIMNQDLVTHLTLNAFRSLQDTPCKAQTVFVQVTTKPQNVKETQKYQSVKLSDGYFCQDVYIPQNINIIKVANIIKAQIIFQKDVFFMVKAKLIYECDQQVGIPKPYNYHEENKHGSNNIPPNIIRRQQQKKQEQNGDNKQQIVMKKITNINEAYFTEIRMIDAQTREFRIRGRLQNKSPLKQFKNKKGWLFDCCIQDKTGCIKLTFFNDMAEQYYEKLSEGKVYSIQDGKVTAAHPMYNKTGHSQEIHVNSKTEIGEIPDQNEMPQQKYNIVKIEKIEDIPQNKQVDILVILSQIFPVQTRTLKNGDSKEMQNIIVKDNTASIQVTFWGENTQKLLNLQDGDIVIMKNLQVKEYSGKSLTFGSYSSISKQVPDIEEYRDVLKIDTKNDINTVKNLSKLKDFSKYSMNFRSLEYIVQECSSLDPDIRRKYRSICHISFIPIDKPLYYKSCPIEKCLKKVEQQGQVYFCHKCNKTFEKFYPRFLVQLTLADSTRSLRILTAGPQACQMIFGMKEQELYEKTSALPENERSNFARQYSHQEISLKINCQRNEYNGTWYNKYSAEDVKLVNGVSTFITTMLFKEVKNQIDHLND